TPMSSSISVTSRSKRWSPSCPQRSDWASNGLSATIRFSCISPWLSRSSLPIRAYGSTSPLESCCRAGGACRLPISLGRSATSWWRARSSPVIAGSYIILRWSKPFASRQLLLEEEFTDDEIKVLLHHNPAHLLYP